jgi:anti-sigma factor RsiW
MNTQHTYCDKIHELILLEDSGELSRDEAQELGKHLDKCPDCDAYRNDVKSLMNESRDALPGGTPSEESIEKVISFAQSDKGNVVFFASPWRIAAGIAAVLAIALGSFLAVHTPNNAASNDGGYGIGDVQIMVALASDGNVTTPSEDSDLTDEAQLKALANTLLKLQGFEMKEQEDTGDVTDLFLPTALQLHSTRVSPAGISV